MKKFRFSGKYLYTKPLKDRPGIQGQTFTLFAAEVRRNSKVTLDPKEHIGFRWVSFNKALKMLTWSDQRKSLRIVDTWLKNGKIQGNNNKKRNKTTFRKK